MPIQQTLKIRPDHLDQLAIIYVRQSTLFRGRENTGSTTRQYDLIKHAAGLRWSASIQVVDLDQGQSGSSSVGRDGFQWLVAEVGLGHVGAVLSLEVSHLARSCSDWYRLLEICALTDTLVIDDEGIYDPGAHNDCLLLGFKGSMSEAELHWQKRRLRGGKQSKAEQGGLRFRWPIGLDYDPVGRIIPGALRRFYLFYYIIATHRPNDRCVIASARIYLLLCLMNPKDLQKTP